jgi:hypothetical protein
MEKENAVTLKSTTPINDIVETKSIKDFCEDGNCEVKVYKDRKYIRRKKKISK